MRLTKAEITAWLARHDNVAAVLYVLLIVGLIVLAGSITGPV